MGGSNSGSGVCGAAKSGKRRTGVDDAVHWIAKYPGIDGFSAAWLHAGGGLVKDGKRYRLSGETVNMKLEQFAEVMKMQGRVFEADERGLIEETPRLVVREVSGIDTKGKPYVRVIKSKAFKVMGAPDPVDITAVATATEAKVVEQDKINTEPFDVGALADSL